MTHGRVYRVVKCPRCYSRDVRHRKKAKPAYTCRHCGHEGDKRSFVREEIRKT